MIRLLINNDFNKQEIIEIELSGGYYDLSKVLWDERQDGPLNIDFVNANLGGIVRFGNELSVDSAKLAAAQVAAQIISDADAAAANEKAARIVLFRNISEISTLSDTKAALIALVQHLGWDKL